MAVSKERAAELADFVAKSWVRRGFGILPGFFDAALDAAERCAGEDAFKHAILGIVMEFEIQPLGRPRHVEGVDRF